MTTRVVGDVAVRVGADVGPLKIGLQDAGRSVDRFGRRTKSRFATLAKNLRNVGLAAAAMAGAVAGASGRAISSLDKIGKKAAQIGIEAEALQELAFVAKSNGVAFEALLSSMERFSKRLGEAEQGFGAAKKQLEFLGLTAAELTNIPLDRALERVADRMADLEDPTERAAAAAGLFGREGVAMVNMMRDGSEGLRQIRDDAREMGAVVSNEAVAAAEDMEDRLGRLTDVIKAQLSEALIAAGPLLIAMAEGLATIAGAAATAITKVSSFAATIREALTKSEEEVAQFEAGMERRRTNQSRRSSRGRTSDGGAAAPDIGGIIGGLMPEGGGEGGDPRSRRNREKAKELAEAAAEAARQEQHAASDARMIAIAEGLEAERAAELAKEEEIAAALREKQQIEHEATKELLKEQAAEIEEQERASGARRIEAAEETEEAITRIMTDEQRARLDAIGNAFGDLASLMQTGNAKLFKIGQAAAIADAVVSGYKAAVDAWEKGMSIGGPPVAAAFTAASLAKTGALIASIKSQQPSGGSGGQNNPGGGGGGVGAGSVDGEGERRVQREITVNLRGGLAGQASGVRDILGQINEELGDGGDLAVNIV